MDVGQVHHVEFIPHFSLNSIRSRAIPHITRIDFEWKSKRF